MSIWWSQACSKLAFAKSVIAVGVPKAELIRQRKELTCCNKGCKLVSILQMAAASQVDLLVIGSSRLCRGHMQNALNEEHAMSPAMVLEPHPAGSRRIDHRCQSKGQLVGIAFETASNARTGAYSTGEQKGLLRHERDAPSPKYLTTICIDKCHVLVI
ncbi:hypothetical protein MMC29_003627 [Sticta canariensis]|nr:hypothetical protein [Sticta canariensis]